MTQLRDLGYQNLQQEKIVDYGKIAQPNVHGLTNKRNTFRSFEDQVNANFN